MASRDTSQERRVLYGLTKVRDDSQHRNQNNNEREIIEVSNPAVEPSLPSLG